MQYFQPKPTPPPAGSSGGVSGLFLLGLLFLALKLTGYIAWSWWLVLLPFYLPLGLVLFTLAGITSVFVAAHFYKMLRTWRIKGDGDDRGQK